LVIAGSWRRGMREGKREGKGKEKQEKIEVLEKKKGKRVRGNGVRGLKLTAVKV